MGIVVIGTVAIFLLPDLRFAVRLPRARLAVESAGSVVVLLTSALSYLRYSLGGARSWLLLSVAFVTLGANQMMFGVLLQPDMLGSQHVSYFWATGRLVAGVLLLVASLPVARRGTRDTSGHLGRFGLLAGASIATLATIEIVLWVGRGRLPLMTEGVQGTVPRMGVVIALGVAGTILYMTAAARFLTVADEPAPPWLPPALVLAAASHVHHMLSPSVFTDWVSTGDMLRASFAFTLLAGLLWEVRRRFVAEQDRSVELAAAYRRERARIGELEALDRDKAEFFSILTHELLQPIAALRGFVATLRAHWSSFDEATRIDILQRLDAQSAALRDMAEGAATAMRLEDPDFAILPQPIPAAEIVLEEAIAPVELTGRLKVILDPRLEDVWLEVDPGRIRQVLRNLLTNAAKYADAEAPVEVRGELRDGLVSFAVVDGGPGLSRSDLSRIFQRFSRVRLAGREHVRGSGLGLYISRRIAEEHGGTLEVQSTPGVGSEFRLTLPTGSGL